MNHLLDIKPDSSLTVCYARVSSYDQKNDLDRQKRVLELFCSTHGWQFQVIEEDLAKDVLEIITVFSARLYGSRSHKNKQIITELKEIAQKL